MVNIKIQIDDTALDQTIRRLGDLSPVYKAWANYVEAVTVEAFQKQTAPWGGVWEELKPWYERYKTGYAAKQKRKAKQAKKDGKDYRNRRGNPKKGGTLKLQWTGALYDSIYSRAEKDGIVAGSNLAVGSLSLGAIHQFGAPSANIPARRFLPLDAEGEPLPQLVAELERMARDYLQN